jgi:diguanylate cyclase
LLNIKQHIQSEQQCTDNFLSHIAEQLAEELEQTVTTSSSAAMEQGKLNQPAIQALRLNANKITELKAIINKRLAILFEEFQACIQKEVIQRQKIQQQLDELTQKVKDMASESSKLKLQLRMAKSQALHDPLTDLPNRLAYEERLKTELARWKRYHSPLSLMVWDVDYFKKINDQFGHKTGDRALIIIAKQLSDHCRETDFICRFGGEEFIMLLPDTDKLSALKLANQLRQLVEKSSFNLNGSMLSITLSCGITEFVGEDTADAAFERADQALYQAKLQGRNQCCIN